jgi:hypothetical protein
MVEAPRIIAGGLSDSEWSAIARILAPEIDAPVLRALLDDLKRERRTPKEIEADLVSKIRNYEGFMRTLPDLPDQELHSHWKRWAASEIARLRKERIYYGKLTKSKDRHAHLTAKKFGILRAWQVAGGELEISTPRKGSPRGAVIDYFAAAAPIIYGENPEPPTIKDIVQRYRKKHLFKKLSGVGTLTVDPAKVELRDAAGNLVTNR